MYHVSAQGVDERMIHVHYYYYYLVVLPQAWYSAPLVRNDMLPRELAMLNWKVKPGD